jgi:hypothetical protein
MELKFLFLMLIGIVELIVNCLLFLAELPEENLDQEVVIRDSRVEYPNNEFFPAQSIGWTGPAAKIGDNKFFITV